MSKVCRIKSFEHLSNVSAVLGMPRRLLYAREVRLLLGTLSKHYLRQISIVGTNEQKIQKNECPFIMSIFKVDITLVPLLFSNFLLVGT